MKNQTENIDNRKRLNGTFKRTASENIFQIKAEEIKANGCVKINKENWTVFSLLKLESNSA